MKAQLSMTIGNKKLVIEGEGKEQDIIKVLSCWTQIPAGCSNCKSTNTALSYRSVKDYEYYGMVCQDCTATLPFGQFKNGGFFIKGSKWEVYEAEQEKSTGRSRAEPQRTEPQRTQPRPQQRQQQDDDSVPF